MNNDRFGFALLNQKEGWDGRHTVASICLFITFLFMTMKLSMWATGTSAAILFFESVEIVVGVLTFLILIVSSDNENTVAVNNFLGSLWLWWFVGIILWETGYRLVPIFL